MNLSTIKAGKMAFDVAFKGIMVVDEEKYKKYSRVQTFVNCIAAVLLLTAGYCLGAKFGWS